MNICHQSMKTHENEKVKTNMDCSLYSLVNCFYNKRFIVVVLLLMLISIQALLLNIRRNSVPEKSPNIHHHRGGKISKRVSNKRYGSIFEKDNLFSISFIGIVKMV